MSTLQRLVILAGLLFVPGSFATAANVSLQNVIATVENPFKPGATGLPPLETMSANFFQKSTIAEKNRELRGEGEVFIKNATANSPLMFRFDYFRPMRQEIVSDGAILWTYLPENKQAIRSELTGTLDTVGFDPRRDRAVNFLQGLGRISKDFMITFASSGMYDQAGNYVLELQPNRTMASIRRMFMVVLREAVLAKVEPVKYPFKPEYAFPILATTMYDHKGNSTSIEFSTIRTNMMLHDSLFSFTPPGYVQVVKPPREAD